MRHTVAKAVALGLILYVVAIAQQDTFFPMGVSLPATWNWMSFLPDVESLGANWAWFDCNQFGRNIDSMRPCFAYADTHGIKLLLLNAGLEAGGLTIKQIASGQTRTYEAEDLIQGADRRYDSDATRSLTA